MHAPPCMCTRVLLCTCMCTRMLAHVQRTEQSHAEADLQFSRVMLRENIPVHPCPLGCGCGSSHPCPTVPSSLTAGICLSKNSPQRQLWAGRGCAPALPQDGDTPPPRGHPCIPLGPGRHSEGMAGWGAPAQSAGGMGTPFPGCWGRAHPCQRPEMGAPKGQYPASPLPGVRHPPPSSPGPLHSPLQPAPMIDAWQSPETTQQVFKNINYNKLRFYIANKGSFIGFIA